MKRAKLSARDQREFNRLLRKAGMPNAPAPRKGGRPKGQDRAEFIAEFIWRHAALHRLGGSKRPIADALEDLYEWDEDCRENPREDFETFKKSTLRLRRTVRTQVEARLEQEKERIGLYALLTGEA